MILKCFFCLMLLCLSVSVQAKTVLISTGEFTPYCSSAIREKGFVSHVISTAFSRQGYDVEFDFYPWKRAIKQSLSGSYDATSWWAYNEDRAKEFLYSDALLEVSVHFFFLKTRNGDFDWKTVDDLDGFRIGVTRGYYLSEEMEAYMKTDRAIFETVNDDKMNFKRLLKGRIDLFPMNSVAGVELLRSQFAPSIIHQVEYHSRAISIRPGYLLFPKNNKDSEELHKAFNKGLKEIKEDGTYEKMYDDLLTGYYSN